jgi:hypothetical protein
VVGSQRVVEKSISRLFAPLKGDEAALSLAARFIPSLISPGDYYLILSKIILSLWHSPFEKATAAEEKSSISPELELELSSVKRFSVTNFNL